MEVRFSFQFQFFFFDFRFFFNSVVISFIRFKKYKNRLVNYEFRFSFGLVILVFGLDSKVMNLIKFEFSPVFGSQFWIIFNNSGKIIFWILLDTLSYNSDKFKYFE